MRTNMLRRAAIALVCALTVLVGQLTTTPWRVASAQAQSARDEAKRHYLEGKRLHDAGDYRGAIREYEAAEQLAPSPINDYNIGLAYDRLGDKPGAATHYRAYLDRMPSAKDRASVQARAAELEAAIAAESAAKGAAESAAAAAREEEARKLAADRAAAATGPAAETPPAGTLPVPAPAAPPSTGDPELDRAASIDVAAMRDSRNAPPPPAAGPAEAGSHERFGDQPATAAAPEAPARKPIYKQWWFWVVVGVSAFILVDIATNDEPQSQRLGATLFRF